VVLKYPAEKERELQQREREYEQRETERILQRKRESEMDTESCRAAAAAAGQQQLLQGSSSSCRAAAAAAAGGGYNLLGVVTSLTHICVSVWLILPKEVVRRLQPPWVKLTRQKHKYE